MGLFSSTKKTYVSSTAYNLAGDLAERPNFLKTTVARSVLMGGPRDSVVDDLLKSQFEGLAMDQKAFYRWALNNYPEGAVSGDISNKVMLSAADTAIASGIVSVPAGHVMQVISAVIDDSDIAYWAEKHILENHPELFGTSWISDFDDTTGQLKIIYEDTTEELVPVPDFEQGATYVFIYYTSIAPIASDGVVQGALQTGLSSRPVTTGYNPVWSQDSYSSGSVNVTVTETVTTTVDDGVNPPDVTVDTTDTIVVMPTSTEILSRTVPQGEDPNAPRFIDENQFLNIWETYEITSTTDTDVTVDGGTTTTVETVTESAQTVWESRTDTETIYRDDMSDNKSLEIYKVGSGNATLDALVTDSGNIPEFFPVIPLRRFNKAIDHADYSTYFDNISQAYNRAVGSDISEVLTSIEDNPQVSDIDHAFLVMGVEVSTEEKEGFRYIYEFFKDLITYQNSSVADLQAWAANGAYADYLDDLRAWTTAQGDVNDPLYGTVRPAAVSRSLPDYSTLSIKSTSQTLTIPYDASLSWRVISESIGVGQGKVGATAGDFWWEVEPDIPDPTHTDGTGDGENLAIFINDAFDISHVRLFWQKTDNTYSYLDIYGMVHSNKVYAGKAVTISLETGVQDTDDSGFVVPLRYDTLRSIPLIQANQLAISNKLIIFNSYTVVTQKWYQKGIFKFLLAVVLTVVTGGTGAGSVGLLGSNLAIGTALGLTGTVALIAGVVVNTLAAVVLTSVVSDVATKAFGDELGSVIASIATFVVSGMTNGTFQPGSGTLNWGELMKAENLIKFSSALAQGVSKASYARVEDIQADMQTAFLSYEDQMDEISELLEDLGYSGGVIDPLWFRETQETETFVHESSDTFLKRTLLTGPVIASMTLEMIDQFADLTLALPDPIR